MKLFEYLESLDNVEINSTKVEAIEKKYNKSMPDIIKKILSINEKTEFLEEERRVLSYKEVLNAPEELQVDFVSAKLIPLLDCYDNDFLVYDFNNNKWWLFNIVDESLFDSSEDLLKLFD